MNAHTQGIPVDAGHVGLRFRSVVETLFVVFGGHYCVRVEEPHGDPRLHGVHVLHHLLHLLHLSLQLSDVPVGYEQ